MSGEPSGSSGPRALPSSFWSPLPLCPPPCKSSFSFVPATEVPPFAWTWLEGPFSPAAHRVSPFPPPGFFLDFQPDPPTLSGCLVFPRAPATPPTCQKRQVSVPLLASACRLFKMKAASFCGCSAALQKVDSPFLTLLIPP